MKENPEDQRTREHNSNCKRILMMLNTLSMISGKVELVNARCAALEDDNEKLLAKCGILEDVVADLKVLVFLDEDDSHVEDDSHDDEDSKDALPKFSCDTQHVRQEEEPWKKPKAQQ